MGVTDNDHNGSGLSHPHNSAVTRDADVSSYELGGICETTRKRIEAASVDASTCSVCGSVLGGKVLMGGAKVFTAYYMGKKHLPVYSFWHAVPLCGKCFRAWLHPPYLEGECSACNRTVVFPKTPRENIRRHIFCSTACQRKHSEAR